MTLLEMLLDVFVEIINDNSIFQSCAGREMLTFFVSF